MKQLELMQLTMRMESGQCIDVEREEFMEAVSGDLEGIDRLFPARASDAEIFIHKISRNWDVEITLDREKGVYRLRKC